MSLVTHMNGPCHTYERVVVTWHTKTSHVSQCWSVRQDVTVHCSVSHTRLVKYVEGKGAWEISINPVMCRKCESINSKLIELFGGIQETYFHRAHLVFEYRKGLPFQKFQGDLAYFLFDSPHLFLFISEAPSFFSWVSPAKKAAPIFCYIFPIYFVTGLSYTRNPTF